MTRVKSSVYATKKHKKLLKRAKGFQGRHKKILRSVKETLLKAGAHAYRGRKEKKRTFRRLWIVRLSAALKELGLSYSQFIKLQKTKKVEINRKILAEIAIQNPVVFAKIVQEIKK
ncbi:50S ribosomal protein L20 [candidate division WWE3 bacterium CG_4_8_14_3_um_filter_42_11]|uniref:Large ribosomal subunit protein bL20 n=2 Tax=Katanobacteria TaxID=422282 RepID=A0A2M7WXF0_UNCKA|nr:MAG: 50S ribosomal protein L20 [candidate division WWE3 bacterium CG_4_9_14_3_um_filter_43_9]PJC68929.1 MAG: 50S ribosomal protein L20 [candidate division WWE3 bacterium CG_4_8_14_3_um_filter_42_11]